jgi:hypothetical protein
MHSEQQRSARQRPAAPGTPRHTLIACVAAAHRPDASSTLGEALQFYSFRREFRRFSSGA